MTRNKIFQFILLAFSISWAMYFLVRAADPDGITVWSTLVLGFLFMWGPAAATFLVQRVLNKDSVSEYGLDMGKALNGKWFALSAIAPIAGLMGTFGVIYVLGNLIQLPGFGEIKMTTEGLMTKLTQLLSERGGGMPETAITALDELSPVLILVVILVIGLLAGVTINLLFAFGEEFGWRGLMQTELRHHGFWKSNLIIGLVWGLWHTPLLLEGHNYVNQPWYFSVPMMVLFCISVSFPMSYLAFKTGNVLSPSGFHGVLNAIGGAVLLFIHDANPLVGNIAGIAGVIAFSLITLGIYLGDRQFIENFAQHGYTSDPSDEDLFEDPGEEDPLT